MMSFLYPADDDPERAARRPLLIFIVVTLVVGALSSVFTEPSIPTWYARLNHPAIAPPNWVFAPVWTGLYILMAVAAFRAWKKAGTNSVEIGSYAIQLLLNFAWSGLFFALHRIDLALVEIGGLDLAVLITAILFFRRDRWAGVMLLPYLGWTLFATLLTYEFKLLNG
jgi:tryptophan-rich sensory protein